MPRGANRVRALAGALAGILKPRLSARPVAPKKILVLHELLLGDTLMLAPLLAALRQRHSRAELFVSCSPEYSELFNASPYGVKVLPYSERKADALSALSPASGCELAILPGNNRHAIAARAIGAQWVVGFAGGRPAWRNRAVDELVDLPPEPEALADLFTRLAGSGDKETAGLRYRPDDWPAPSAAPFDIPGSPYGVLHVGAGSPLRLWEPQKWLAVAQALVSRGIQPVWTAGPNEEKLVRAIDPESHYRSYAGQLGLAQLWQLLAGARLAVTLDTGIAHMAKLTSTPVAALFGPGSAQLFGKGRFWRDNPFAEVTIGNFACRDQHNLFKREVQWVRRCNRKPPECPRARCMEAIAPEMVLEALPVE